MHDDTWSEGYLAAHALFDAAPDLLGAVRGLLSVVGRADEEQICHFGLTSMKECGRCSRIIAAEAAIAKAEPPTKETE